MLKRHATLRDFVCKLDHLNVDDVLLHAFFVLIIGAFLTKLKELKDVVLKLQLHLCTIQEKCLYSDSVYDILPTVNARLNQPTRVVYRPVHESALVLIRIAREREITTSEKRAVRNLLLEQVVATETDTKSDSVDKQVMN